MQKKSVTLYELNKTIQLEVNETFPGTFWITAEIGQLKENYSGHCYLELIEKNPLDETIIAKARAIIWSRKYHMLKSFFETTTGQEFREGLKILINAGIEFHEIYGYSLNILDLDPTYTIGDLEKQKQDTIRKLVEEGVIDMNKGLEISAVPQRIAVISSKTAAGYGDFGDQLEKNAYGYKIYYRLFPAIMQGDGAEDSIIKALERIYQYEGFFDLVAIIRGGGSKSDLQCFNRYWLAYYISQFPLPVITGIGHEQDETVTDLVAHTKLKTPTAVAEYIIDRLAQFDTQLDQLKSDFVHIVTAHTEQQQQKLELYGVNLSRIIKYTVNRNTERLNEYLIHSVKYTKKLLKSKLKDLFTTKTSLDNLISKRTTLEKYKLEVHAKNLRNKSRNFLMTRTKQLLYYKKSNDLLDPQHVLNRGFSMTTVNGRVIKNVEQVSMGDEITTRLKTGSLLSKITKKT